MKMSFEKIVVIVIALVVIVSGVVLFGMSKHDTKVDVSPAPDVSETVPEVEVEPETEAAPEANSSTDVDIWEKLYHLPTRRAA